MFGLRQWLTNENPRAESENPQTELLTRAILDELGVGIFALDVRGRVEFWSKGAAELTRKDQAAVLGKEIQKILPMQNADSDVRGQFWQTVKTRESVVQEYSFKKRPLQLTLKPLFDDRKNTIGLLGELRDITAEKQVEAMKIDFVNIVSHELRTPISAIKGYLATVLDEADYLDPEHREYVKRAFESNERELSTVESLLDVSRIERGTIKIDARPIQLESLIYEVIEGFSEEAREKGLELKFTPPHLAISRVKADPVRTREVLSNLISNALKYTHKGSVTVSVEEEGEMVWTQIKDTGIGIPKDKREHLFEKFVRGERSLTEESPGTGLGLYIVKNFVEMMNGEVEFESIEDHGTTFRFSLPQAN